MGRSSGNNNNNNNHSVLRKFISWLMGASKGKSRSAPIHFESGQWWNTNTLTPTNGGTASLSERATEGSRADTLTWRYSRHYSEPVLSDNLLVFKEFWLESQKSTEEQKRRDKFTSRSLALIEAATKSLVNKSKLNSNTHIKSVNVFLKTFSHLLFRGVEKLSKLINFCYTSRFVGVTWGNCRRRLRMGSLASLAGQGESVSLMAYSLCRCHLVIILRQPSASWSCRAWPLSLLGLVWLAGSMLLSLLSWPATPPASSVQKARLVRARGKTEDTRRETKKKALNS